MLPDSLESLVKAVKNSTLPANMPHPCTARFQLTQARTQVLRDYARRNNILPSELIAYMAEMAEDICQMRMFDLQPVLWRPRFRPVCNFDTIVPKPEPKNGYASAQMTIGPALLVEFAGTPLPEIATGILHWFLQRNIVANFRADFTLRGYHAETGQLYSLEYYKARYTEEGLKAEEEHKQASARKHQQVALYPAHNPQPKPPA
jgi:hypothetical protein